MNKSLQNVFINCKGMRVALFSCLCSLTSLVLAQQATFDYLSIYPKFTTGAFKNPALHYYYLPQSYTQIQADYTYQNSPKAVQVQDGRGISKAQVSADAFRFLKENTRIWGTVNYQNKLTYDVRGTENIDYHLVYPYVLSDTLGGDMKSEMYFFTAGYARQMKAFILGLTLGYRAVSAYRDHDPRPRNKVGQLSAQLGLAWKISNQYLLGTMLGAERYKQSQSLKYYDPLKFKRLFHENGLGMEYTRFAGNKTDNIIQGNFYHVTFSLYPRKERGWGAAFGYHYSTFEKMLTGYNDVPINDIEGKKWTAHLYYQQQKKKKRWAVKCAVQWKERQGKENIFGGEATHTYEQISSRPYYKNKTMRFELSAFYERNVTMKTRISFFPSFLYTRDKQLHLRYKRQLRIYALQSNLKVAITHQFKKSGLHLQLGVMHRQAVDDYLSLPHLNKQTYWYQNLTHNYRMLKGNHTMMQLDLRYDTPWKIVKKTFYLLSKYRWGHYPQSLQTHSFKLGLGIVL